MKKLVAFLLLAFLALSLCSCGLFRNPIAAEYSGESYITLENKVNDLVTSVTITGCFDGKERDSVGMEASDGETLRGGTVTYCVHRDAEIKQKDLKNFSIKVTVTEIGGNSIDVDTISFPLEFGKDYQFALARQDDAYQVREIDANGSEA